MKESFHFNIKVSRFIALGAMALAVWIPGQMVVADDGSSLKPKEAAAKPASTEEISFDNSVIFAGTAAIINGDKSQFQQRHGVDRGFSGGIEDFHWQKPIDKDTTFLMEGHGLFDNHDYKLNLEVVRPDVGYIKAGYTEFRTWYDGSGGFLPQNGQWFSLYDSELAVDRGEAWFEAALTLPDLPVLTFRYSHQFRDGQKDSTSWGDTGITGGFGNKKITPSFWDLNEQRDTFEGSLKHTVDITKIDVGLSYELTHNDDSLNEHLNPTESTDRYMTQHEVLQADAFSVHATTETWFNDKLLFATGYSFMTMNSDIGGNRIYGTGYDAPFLKQPTAALSGVGFIDLNGGSEVDQYVANTSLMVIPWDDLTLTAALRAEQEDQNGIDSYLNTTTAAIASYRGDLSENHDTKVAQSLEARYTGLADWVLYASGGWVESDGTAMFNQVQNAAQTLTSDGHVDQNISQFEQKYTMGANWYPLRQVNASTQYYHKIQDNSYVDRNDTSITTYPGLLDFQNFTVDNVNVRVTVRPLNNLTFVTRYDYQITDIDTKVGSLAFERSALMRSHRVGESATWNALSTLYFQANGNYVLNQTECAADDLTSGLIQLSQNNYWDASLVAGWAVSQKTDLQTQYNYYRAADFYNTQLTVPYGAGADQWQYTLEGSATAWGPTDTIKLAFVRRFARFSDLATPGDLGGVR